MLFEMNEQRYIRIPGRGLVEVTIIGTNGNYHTCEGDEGVFLQPTPKQRILALIKSKL